MKYVDEYRDGRVVQVSHRRSGSCRGGSRASNHALLEIFQQEHFPVTHGRPGPFKQRLGADNRPSSDRTCHCMQNSAGGI